jgi:hypothetical protein
MSGQLGSWFKLKQGAGAIAQWKSTCLEDTGPDFNTKPNENQMFNGAGRATSKWLSSQAPVAHACNPSYS